MFPLIIILVAHLFPVMTKLYTVCISADDRALYIYALFSAEILIYVCKRWDVA